MIRCIFRFHSTRVLFTFLIDRIFFSVTAQKMKFFIKDLFSKCDQIRSFLRIWSHLLKKSLIENFVFVQWVLSDRVFFEYSVIGFSSGSTVINSFLRSSVLFFRNIAILLSNRATVFFYQKQMFCFTLYSQKEACTQQLQLV